MPTRYSLSVAVIMSQPVNVLSALAQAMGTHSFGQKEWCGKVKVVPKVQRSRGLARYMWLNPSPEPLFAVIRLIQRPNFTPDIQC